MNKVLLGILLIFNSLLLLYADSIVVPSTPEKITTSKVHIDSDSPIENSKFRPLFKEKYQHLPEFNYSAATDSTWTRFKNRIIRWIDRFFTVEIGDNPRQIWNNSLNYISVILLLGLTFYIVRAFIKKDAFWFLKKSKKPFELVYTEIEKDLEQIHFKSLIDQALQNDDRRLAIRYYYLWLLKILSKNGIIQWDLEKTNSDYLTEIKDEEIKKSFQYLSYLYNNIWYGEFDVDLVAFQKAQQAFTDFINPWKDE